jgi:hypothetical protein
MATFRSGLWRLFFILLATLISCGRAEAQVGSPVRQVRWPLLDIVMVPDSTGLWFMAAPTPSTTLWESGSHLVRFDIDPVLALQWVTVARRLVLDSPPKSAHFTPPLPAKDGPAMAVLGTNPEKPSKQTQFVFIVSDSASDTRWKSFASSLQVDEFLNALEATARDSREGSFAGLWNTPADQEPDTPVSVVSQPMPEYPGKLASGRRIGRVWMAFVVTPEGRAEPGSFLTLLSDDSLFTESATRALLRGRYRAAVKNGQAVPQRVYQTILFRQR